MEINAKRIKIFKIKNRKGYGAVCMICLTEGKTTYQTYERMTKALKKSGIVIKRPPSNLKSLITKVG